MDALEQYLKIEKMDPTEVSESSIKHKEEKHSQMNQQYKDVENNGKAFIKDAKEVRYFADAVFPGIEINT